MERFRIYLTRAAPAGKNSGTIKMRTNYDYCPLATPANLATLRASVEAFRPRSAWSRGVRAYALDLIDSIEEMSNYEMNNYGEYLAISEEVALNGADCWSNYAAGGCGLVYTSAILERLCTASALRRLSRSGRCDIDAIEIEGRALSQAWQLLRGYICQL